MRHAQEQYSYELSVMISESQQIYWYFLLFFDSEMAEVMDILLRRRQW